MSVYTNSEIALEHANEFSLDRSRGSAARINARMYKRSHVSELHAVIFDIDGTLTDSVDIHALAWQEALRHFGHDVPYLKVRQQIGKGGDQLLKALLSDNDFKDHGEKLDEYRGDLFMRKYMKHIRPFAL